MQTCVYIYVDFVIDIFLLIKTLQVAPIRKKQKLSKSEMNCFILKEHSVFKRYYF